MKRLLLTSASVLAASAALAQDQVIELAPIVVDGALRDERPLLETPVATTVREGGALDRRLANDFEELVGDLPGVSIDGGPRGIAQEPNIRGFQDEQIVLRFDGARQNFNQAHRGRFFVDPDIVQRIEVVRGGGSTLFGSGALGGVISVETRDVDDLLAPGLSFGARVRGGYASNGEVGTGSVTLFGRSGNVDGLLFLGTRDFGADVEDGNGDRIRNSQIDVQNGLLKLGFEPTEDQRFELNLSHYEDQGTTPPNANAASDGSNDVDRDATNTTWRLSWDYTPEESDFFDLSVLFYGNQLNITEDRDSDGRNDETDYDTVGFEVVNRSSLDLGAPVRLVYGIEAFEDSQTGKRNGEARAQFPDATATTIAAFAEATAELSSAFNLILGLRFDDYDRRPDADDLDDVDEQFWSPRVGFSYRPNENWQVFGNVARAFRAPSLTELYNDGVHFATPGFPLEPGTTFTGVNRFIPNPDLEPEKSTQVELGTRFEQFEVWSPGDRLYASANVYYAEVEDYINQVVNFIDFETARFGPGGLQVGGSTTSSNVDARLWGFEAELDYDAVDWFASAGLTLPRGETTDGDPLGSIPQDRLTLALGYRPTTDWELGLRGTFAAEQTDVPEESEPTDGFTVVDLFASWMPQSGPLEGAEVRAGIDNVFDEFYTIYPNGLAQPGRTYKITAAFTF